MVENMPNVWGAGQLLAFSGIDGQTDWAEPFVLHTGEKPGDLLVRLPQACDVRFDGMPALDFRVVLGDAIVAGSARGQYRVAFVDHHTLAGELPEGVEMLFGDVPVGESPVRVGDKPGLIAVRNGRRWCIAHAGVDVAESASALQADLDKAITDRMCFVTGVPVPAGLCDGRTRLLQKALSVMKVNAHSACGTIGRRWTTPDRWPHQHMWLWDSAFHAVGMARVDTDLAKDAVLAMLEQVQPDGMLPHTIHADGKHSGITQPPILGWAALEVVERTGDLEWAGVCLPLLLRHLEWDVANRDRNGNGIPEWFIEGSPLCRCGESGLDNSSVYDRAVLLDAPDFGSFLSHDFACCAEIATRLGDAATARACEDRAEHITCAIRDTLWNGRSGIFCHRDFDGSFVETKAVSGFMPLFAGIATPAQAEALRRHLGNPATFGAPFPVPSESLDSGTFCKDMWRGPAWVNMSYLVCLGLRRYGFHCEAATLREKLIAGVQHWYEREGCIYEYYDSLNVTSPRMLDRKQRLISGRGMAPISDYHWTAALTAALLLE